MHSERARQEQVRRKRERARDRANEARWEKWQETKDEYGFYGPTPPEVRRKAEKRTEQRMRANLRKEVLEAEAVSIRSREAEEAERKAAASEIREVCAQEVEAQAKRKAAVAELEEVEAQALLEEKQKKKKQNTHTKVIPPVPVFPGRKAEESLAEERKEWQKKEMLAVEKGMREGTGWQKELEDLRAAKTGGIRWQELTAVMTGAWSGMAEVVVKRKEEEEKARSPEPTSRP